MPGPPRVAGDGVAAGTGVTVGEAGRSAQVFWDFEGVADGPPDDFGVYAVRESALGGASAEIVEDEVLGHALRVGVAELRPHPVPEFRQPHPARVLPGPGWTGAGIATR